MEDFEREAAKAWSRPPLPVRQIHVTDAFSPVDKGPSASCEMVRIVSVHPFSPLLLAVIRASGVLIVQEEKPCEDWQLFNYTALMSYLHDTKQYVEWLRGIDPKDWL